MPATLRLVHKAIGVEVRRGTYDVTGDGRPAGSVEMNETIDIPVEPGRHIDPAQATGRYLVAVLRQLGYRASLRIINPITYYQQAGNSRTHTQIGEFSWYQDFPAPSDFIDRCSPAAPSSRMIRPTLTTASSATPRSTPRQHRPAHSEPAILTLPPVFGRASTTRSSTRPPGYLSTIPAPWSCFPSESATTCSTLSGPFSSTSSGSVKPVTADSP